jgi:HD superfamily phosphohydrolase
LGNQKKRKIINDPVYGFISIPYGMLFDLVEHPYFQRLRRIKQLGLTNFVYPGATHTRFQHALGAFHLMNSAINILKSKGCMISDEEANAVSAAILLHDIGHGPFSHALEYSLVERITHEDISGMFMDYLSQKYNLSLAKKIFRNQYSRKFLNQLVSSQLDMDRLDYLRRDCFFTGVTEGTIGSDRIIKMLSVINDQLVVEAKGIYSIENFLIARRLMYWQVYSHKAAIAAEQLLVKILKRAKELANKKVQLFGTPALKFFLYNNINKETILSGTPSFDHNVILEQFSNLDDNDIVASIKVWTEHPDFTLSFLSKKVINRNLFRVEIQDRPFDENKIREIKLNVRNKFKVENDVLDYYVFTDSISNKAYIPVDPRIRILFNNGQLIDITDASDMLDVSVLSKTVTKYFLCYPKNYNVS